MAQLKLIDEIGVNDTLLTLENAWRCDCRCTWCYVELNRKRKDQDRTTPDTFASTVARSFGPDYDPTNFVQYLVHNRLPINWASGVEPWQDIGQAKAILDVGERLGLSWSFQSRGLNWREVWPQVKAFARTSYICVSLSTLDPKAIKRFEPGTPPIAERIALVEAAVSAGMPVMLSVAPYHREWCGDLAAFVRDMIGRGVSCVFVDPLHLSPEQLEAATDPELGRLEESAWSEEAVREIAAARDATVEAGRSWQCIANDAWIEGVESVDPLGWTAHLPVQFGYHHHEILDTLAALEPEGGKPLLIEWPTALAIMEGAGAKAGQPFRWSVIRPAFRVFMDASPGWVARLKPSAPFREYLRFCWNRPCIRGFMWSNPFVRSAVKPDGTPWLSESGDLVLSFDPTGDHRTRQVFESLDGLDVLVAATE